MEKKVPTIKEIAKRLNVSVSTVSRALHNHPSIGLRTRMQVHQVAKELNYEPNQAAIFFKKGKSFTIGVILPNLQEEYFSIAINGIEKVAIENGYNVLISQSHDDAEREKAIVETMRKNRVDGIIVSVAKKTADYEHFIRLREFNIPVVFFDRVPFLPEMYTVSCNLKKSTEEMVSKLVKLGHKKIAFIRGPEAIGLAKERYEGYIEALKKNKIKEEKSWIVQTDLTTESAEKAMARLLALKKQPTAVIAFNDYVALDAMRYAKKQGIKVNKDIVFASYANLPLTAYLDDPPYLSVEQFPYQQAEKAAEILFRLINKDNGVDQIPYRHVMESRVVVH